ncbi:hypothetical protein TNCV_3604011 [Trichonephila clavipes]|nr:hypothetical protein TNCV_3604011 [Trichonephila clavipes]
MVVVSQWLWVRCVMSLSFTATGHSGLQWSKIGSWEAGHEFETSTTKDPPYRAAMHVQSVESSNILPLVWCGS